MNIRKLPALPLCIVAGCYANLDFHAYSEAGSAGSGSTMEPNTSTQSTSGQVPTSSTATTSDGTSASMTGLTTMSIDTTATFSTDATSFEDTGMTTGTQFEKRRIVFVTEATYDGNLGGIEGANKKCTAAASTAAMQIADFPAPSASVHFFAWIATDHGTPIDINDDSSPLELITKYHDEDAGPYVLPDLTTVVAETWQDLTDGSLSSPIDMTEVGAHIAEKAEQPYVWTNVAPDGALPLLREDCNKWNSGSDGIQSVVPFVGDLRKDDSNWTRTAPPQGALFSCSKPKHLYCIEVHANPG